MFRHRWARFEIAGSTSTPTSPSPVATSLVLAVSPTSSVAGATVTLTGTAAMVSGSTPTGTVTFTVGGSTMTATLNAAGTATAAISTLAAGSYTATASYGGDVTFAATTAASVAVTVTPVASAPPPSNLSLSVGQPVFGFNVIPGAVRRLFATVTNGTTNGVNWTVKSGGAAISAATGSWIDVTAPSAGSSCLANRSGSGSISSATQFVIEATSQEDATQVTDVTFNVCSPTVQVSIVPAYRTLYAGQAADLQSLVVGIRADGGDLGDPIAAAGRGWIIGPTQAFAIRCLRDPSRVAMSIAATSSADGSTVATTTMYVTGNPMPYQVTQSLTEPVDCTVDPALGGTTYDVGPSQAYQQLANVPIGSLSPGSTIRLHNEDTTGSAPTVYNEAIQITASAQADQPIRLCGVPDKAGNLPIMDGSSAMMHPDVHPTTAGSGVDSRSAATQTSMRIRRTARCRMWRLRVSICVMRGVGLAMWAHPAMPGRGPGPRPASWCRPATRSA